jgi:type I restriction enzyme S subunit
VNTGWTTSTIGELCQLRPPKSEAREKLSANDLVSFAGMEALGIDRKFLEPESTKPLSSVSGSYTYFANGDVLLAKITPCFENGKLGIADELQNSIGFGSSEFVVLRPDSRLDKEFLYYYLLRPDFRTEGAARMGGAVGQQRVPKEFIEKYPIPLPPLQEQQRIVGILDKAFAAIATAKANTEKNLHNARALFDSHLESVFSRRGPEWVDKRLSEVSNEFGRGKSKHRPRNDPKLYGGEYPFIQTGDIRNSAHLISSYTQTYNKVGLSQSKLWPAGTVCITIAANIAETGILTFDACFPDSVVGVVTNKSIANNKFLEYQLQSFKTRLQALGKGSAQDNINMGTFENQLFSFPSLEMQIKIVSTLDALREETQRLEAIYQKKLAALEALKKSLLHQAFRGQL